MPGLVQHVGQLVAAVGRVDVDQDRADLRGRVLHEHPLGAVRRPDADPVALGDAQRQQAERERVDVGVQLAVGPAPVRRHVDQRLAVAAAGHRALQVGPDRLAEQRGVGGGGGVGRQRSGPAGAVMGPSWPSTQERRPPLVRTDAGPRDCTPCPAPGTTTSRDAGRSAWARRAQASGVDRSREPCSSRARTPRSRQRAGRRVGDPRPELAGAHLAVAARGLRVEREQLGRREPADRTVRRLGPAGRCGVRATPREVQVQAQRAGVQALAELVRRAGAGVLPVADQRPQRVGLTGGRRVQRRRTARGSPGRPPTSGRRRPAGQARAGSARRPSDRSCAGSPAQCSAAQTSRSTAATSGNDSTLVAENASPGPPSPAPAGPRGPGARRRSAARRTCRTRRRRSTSGPPRAPARSCSRSATVSVVP